MNNRRPLRSARLFQLAMIVLVLILLSSCGSDDTIRTGDGGAQGVDGVWVLDSLTVDGSAVPVLADLEMSVEGGRINGDTGCNSFGGAIEVDESGGASILDLSMTEMACVEPERMTFEGTYAQALGAVDSWVRGPVVLTLASPRATLGYVVAEPVENLPLEQTSWVLDTIFSGSGDAGTASSTDQQSNSASLIVDAGFVRFAAEGCPDLQLDAVYEGGGEGSFDVMADGADLAPCGDVNWDALVDGVLAADSYAINENRLTISSGSSPLVGLTGS